MRQPDYHKMLKVIIHSDYISDKWKKIAYDLRDLMDKNYELTPKQENLIRKLYMGTEVFR